MEAKRKGLKRGKRKKYTLGSKGSALGGHSGGKNTPRTIGRILRGGKEGSRKVSEEKIPLGHGGGGEKPGVEQKGGSRKSARVANEPTVGGGSSLVSRGGLILRKYLRNRFSRLRAFCKNKGRSSFLTGKKGKKRLTEVNLGRIFPPQERSNQTKKEKSIEFVQQKGTISPEAHSILWWRNMRPQKDLPRTAQKTRHCVPRTAR